LYDFQVHFSSQSTKPGSIIMIPTIAVPIVDGLGYTLEMLGRYGESEFCFRTLLHYYISTDPSIDRTKEPYLPTDDSIPMGRQHPEALKSINKLAKVLQAQSKFREAEVLCGDSLDDCIQTLGVNHPTTQTSVVTMAQLKHSQGKLAEAEEMYRRALACNEEVLGFNHIETLANVSHIADLRAEQRDFRTAEILYSRVLTGYEMVLGGHNSTTIEAVHNVGAMLLKQQKPTQALVFLNRALEERSAYYGDAHPATLATLFCVGKAYHLESLWKHRPDYHELVSQGLETLERALAGFDVALGAGSVQAIEVCEYLAEFLLQCNRFSAAIPFSRRVYLYYHHGGVLPPEHKSKINKTNNNINNNNKNNNNNNAPSRPPSRVQSVAAERAKKDNKLSPYEDEIKPLFGPMHKRTAEAAYQLGTLLENCNSEIGMSDYDRHTEAANLFAQAAEVYRQQLERYSRDAEYCERNSVRRTYDYNFDSAEGKVPDDEVSIEELRELMEDAQEQHQHAARCSMY